MSETKLIRDRIPEIIRQNGENCQVRTASDQEYQEKLYKKLQEECREFLESKDEEELADILEVVYSICKLKNISKQQLETLRKKKAKARGSFGEKLLLTIHNENKTR